ncbi:hypothetical protein D3C87_2066070 [compost metagenome]
MGDAAGLHLENAGVYRLVQLRHAGKEHGGQLWGQLQIALEIDDDLAEREIGQGGLDLADGLVAGALFLPGGEAVNIGAD